jgi:hypothetical protein
MNCTAIERRILILLRNTSALQLSAMGGISTEVSVLL